jgi:hypothetical protein
MGNLTISIHLLAEMATVQPLINKIRILLFSLHRFWYENYGTLLTP